ERNTSRHRRRQKHPPLCDFMDCLDKILRIAGFGNVALGADLDGPRGEYRIVVHAKHNETGRCVACEEAPCKLESGNRRKIDVEYADIRMLFAENALATLSVGGFQYLDSAIVR